MLESINNHNYKASLSKSIYDAYIKLIQALDSIGKENSNVSVDKPKPIDRKKNADIIAYQIGWGQLLLSWYTAGIQGKKPQMPGEGFTTWDYKGLAEHFAEKYQLDAGPEQLSLFKKTVQAIINITEKEFEAGNLDKLGVWQWCTLKSGKQWPLSKWIQVNTVAPYKRAAMQIKKLANNDLKVRNS